MPRSFYYKKSQKNEFSLLKKVLLISGIFSWVWLLTYTHRFKQAQKTPPYVLRDPDVKPAYTELWQPQYPPSFPAQLSTQHPYKAALVTDFRSGRIFFAKNARQELPIASLTKIMTAIITLDHAPLSKELVVPPEATDLPSDSSIMGISAGEIYSVEELLYGLLLPSGNDAARTLAIHIGGNRENFAYLMNRKAKALGLQNTHFTNPSGLDHPENYSSTHDLAILSHYAVTKYPTIQEIVAARQYEIPASEDNKYLFWGNFNDLMLVYEGVDGIKPGNTEEAGSCLIATATRGDQKVMAIVLGTTYRNFMARQLLDLGFEQLSP